MSTLWPKRADTIRVAANTYNQSEMMQGRRRSLRAHRGLSTQGLIQSGWLQGSRVAGFAAVAVGWQALQQWQ